MDAVQKAKNRYRQYPILLAKCSKEASNYAKCVLKKDNINFEDCSEEFKLFKCCLQKSATNLKTRI